MKLLPIALIIPAAVLASPHAMALNAGFDDLTLAAESHWNARDEWQAAGGPATFDATFESGQATFQTQYAYDSTFEFESWSGFAYSNETNTATGGFGNQFSAFTGGGHGGSANYGVVFGYHEPFDTSSRPAFDPTSAADLQALPSLTLPSGAVAQDVWVTNTTYVALAVRDGIEFSPGVFGVEPFGGLQGGEPDWFKLSVYGIGPSGAPLPVEVEFYLADYRGGEEEDYIVSDWTRVDLSPLAGAATLHFNLSSSDFNSFGMVTPGYFALDDLSIAAGPLPGDYNGDLRVDAADYAAWRGSLDQEVAFPGDGADGDLSGVVDQGDYTVWRRGYGSELPTAAPVAAIVPEPLALALLLPTLAGLTTRRYA